MINMDEIDLPIVYLSGYGFEDRTVAVTRYMIEKYGSRNKLLHFALSFGDPSSDLGRSRRWQQNKYFLDEFFSKYADNYIRVSTTIRSPIDILVKFREVLDNNRIEINDSYVVFDITSFPKTTLLAVLRELLSRKASGMILYVEPKEYELPISIGVKYHGLLPFFGRHYDPDRKRILWVLLGFEGQRAYGAWSNIDPDETIAFVGEPFYENRRWKEISMEENKLIVSSPNVKIDKISFSNVNKAVSKLEETYYDYQNENIIIAPLGTKFSTLCLGYFTLTRDNVFVLFSSAERETEHQSLGSKAIISCEFDSVRVGEPKRLEL